MTSTVKPDPKTLTCILSLRYNPQKKSLRPKTTWKDFVEKAENNSIDFIEKSITNNLKKKIKNSTKQVSISLSGGVDSTLVLALLRKTLPDISIKAITVKFADSVDETKQAAKIARKFEADHEVMYLENFLIELPKTISIIKQPFWDLHWYHVVKKAKSFSKFLVSGDGGDELFGGYTFRYKKFLSLINPDSTPEQKVKAYLQCHERDWVPGQELVFGKKAKFSWDKIFTSLKSYFDNNLPPLSQVFLADSNGKLLYNWIPIYAKIHKHFGVELVAPILAQPTFEYATHIPNRLKYDNRNNKGKLLLLKLLKKYVSNSLLTQKKQGFSVNTINLWKSHGMELCKYYLTDARSIKDGWINGEWVKIHMKKTERSPDVRYVNKFLGLLAFEIWYRLFITKEIKPNTTLG